jgi:hypothetical protein
MRRKRKIPIIPIIVHFIVFLILFIRMGFPRVSSSGELFLRIGLPQDSQNFAESETFSPHLGQEVIFLD